MVKVLAVTSGGGHWDEMMILIEDLSEFEIIYANTFPGLDEISRIDKCYLLSDCNRNTPVSVIKCAVEIWHILRSERPDFIISTGAAPGIIAIIIGSLLRCETIWVDSIANSNGLSMSGRIAGVFAKVWLTQWQHLARKKGPHYWGSVI